MSRRPDLIPVILAFGVVATWASAAPTTPHPRPNAGNAGQTAAQTAPLTLPTTVEGEEAGFLYNQLDHATGEGVPDQDFEAALDAFDAEAADDFHVTHPFGWELTWIKTTGSTDGVATSVDIAVHFDESGVPGATICRYDALIPLETAGSFHLSLPSPCLLAAGTYWLSVQTNQEFASQGQHFWSNRTLRSGHAGIWRNPGNGFETDCTAWSAQQGCGVGDSQGQDFLFALGGQLIAGPPPPQADIPTLGWPGLASLVTLLAGLGALVLRRQS